MNTRHLFASIPAAAFMWIAVALCAPRLWAEEATAREVAPGEAEEALRKCFQQAVNSSPKNTKGSTGPNWQLALTTWLPGEWPPSPKTLWTRYAYGLDAALVGVSGVSAPIARLERPAGDARHFMLVPMAGTLNRIGSHAVRRHGGWNYTREDEQGVLRYALALTGEPPAGAPSMLGLISYFQSWQLGSAEIAAHVAPHHRAFFAWLKQQAEPAKFIPPR